MVLLIAAVAAGCGGDSSTTAETASATDGKASTEFIVKGKKNTVVKFGEEADVAEREAASKILEDNLKARAAGDWAEQCKTLTVELQKDSAKRGQFNGAGKTCAKGLESEAELVPASVRASTLTGHIDVLRVDGDRAFALYHGTKGRNYAVEMTKEGGQWRVASVLEKKLPEPKS